MRKRKRNLFILSLVYPLFTGLQLKFGHEMFGNLGDSLLFTVSPVFFIMLVIREWKASDEKLVIAERRSLNYFILTYITIHIYYCLCALNNLCGGEINWIVVHNNYIFYYLLITSIIFFIFNSHEP